MSRGLRRRRTTDGPLTRAQEVQRAFRERRRKQKEHLEGKLSSSTIYRPLFACLRITLTPLAFRVYPECVRRLREENAQLRAMLQSRPVAMLPFVPNTGDMYTSAPTSNFTTPGTDAMAVPPNTSQPLVGSSPLGLEPPELSSGATTPFYPPANQQGLALQRAKPSSASTSPFAPVTGTPNQQQLGLNIKSPATSSPFAPASTSLQGLSIQPSSNSASASPFAPATAGQAALHPSVPSFAPASTCQQAFPMGNTGESSAPTTPFNNGEGTFGQASGTPTVLDASTGFRYSLSLALGTATSSPLVATNHVPPLPAVPVVGSFYGGGSSTNGQESLMLEPNIEQPLQSAPLLSSNRINAPIGTPSQGALIPAGTLGAQTSAQTSGTTQSVRQPIHHSFPSAQPIHGSSLTNAHGGTSLHPTPTIPSNNLDLNALQPTNQQPNSIPLLSHKPLLFLPQYNLLDAQVPPSNAP